MQHATLSILTLMKVKMTVKPIVELIGGRRLVDSRNCVALPKQAAAVLTGGEE